MGLSLQRSATHLDVQSPLEVVVVGEAHGHLRENASYLLTVLLVQLVQSKQVKQVNDGTSHKATKQGERKEEKEKKGEERRRIDRQTVNKKGIIS